MRKKKLGEIIEWRMGPAGELLPVVMAKIVNKQHHVVSVISHYTGNIKEHGGNPDIENKNQQQ